MAATRTNLIINPSFEVSTSGWSASGSGGSGTLSRSTAQAAVGTASLAIAANANGTSTSARTYCANMSVTPGYVYTFQVRMRSATTARNVVISIIWDNGTSVTGSTTTAVGTTTTDGWTTFTRTGFAPSGATVAYVEFGVRAASGALAAGEVHYADALMFEQTDVASPYIDGDSANAVWNGTPHGSTSTWTEPAAPVIPTNETVDDFNKVLRLEVEVPVTGLPNLVQNPSGHLGSWFWITPVVNTTLKSEVNNQQDTLLFSTTPSQAAYFTSEYMPVAAGRYVGARFDLKAITTGHNVKVSFEWYNSSKALISTSTQTAALSTVQTHYVPSVLAPTNTAFVKIRFDLYNGVAVPLAGANVRVNKVMVTHAESPTALGTLRTNLITNPSFETNVTGWTALSSTLTRATDQFRIGSGSMKVASSNASSVTAAFRRLVNGGKDHTLTISVRPTSVVTSLLIKVRWYSTTDGKGPEVGSPMGAFETYTANTWKDYYYTGTAPSNAKSCSIDVTFYRTGTTTGVDMGRIDKVMFEEATELFTYFDGSTTSTGKTYAWTGTAHNSTSTETTGGTTYDFVEPVKWQNILGPTHEISISRKDLDVGILNATIYDAMLDPAVSDTIKPGKRIRLMAYTVDIPGAIPDWDPVFTGKVSNAYVTYPRDKVAGSQIQTHIQVSATDAVSDLANQGEYSGVQSINDLPYLLEGKGVAWDVNGSGDQTATAQVVSYNENASVLDQIAVTRDTALGFAWVARNNVLTVQDKTYWNNTPSAFWEFTDNITEDWEISYSDIDVDFDLARCINEVTVKWLRYDIGRGETTEVTYGPYINQSSIDQWGPRSATFTIQGATEDASAIAAYAQSILTANATPTVKANSLTMPVRTEKELSAATRLDLYDYTTVTYGTKVNAGYAITGIEHKITPTKWDVTFEFGKGSSVASPTWVPSPPFKGVTGTAEAGFVQMFAGQPTALPSGWLLCNGGTFSSTQYPALAAVLGDTYGVHSGTTYYLPDFRRRLPMGPGTSVPVGRNEGVAAESSRTPAHTHSTPNHTHTDTFALNKTAEAKPTGTGGGQVLMSTTSLTGGVSSSGGGTTGAASFDTVVPYLVVNFIIKV